MRPLALFVVIALAGCSKSKPTEPPPANNHDEALANVKKLGGSVSLDERRRVIGVSFGPNSQVTNENLKDLRYFTELQDLNLCFVKVTENGLQEVGGLTHLRKLD